MTQLRFLEAHTETHFKDMSLLHALAGGQPITTLFPKTTWTVRSWMTAGCPSFMITAVLENFKGSSCTMMSIPCAVEYMALCGRSFSPKAYPVWPSGESWFLSMSTQRTGALDMALCS